MRCWCGTEAKCSNSFWWRTRGTHFAGHKAGQGQRCGPAHRGIGSNCGTLVAVGEGGHAFTQVAGHFRGGQSPVGQNDRARNLIMRLGPPFEAAKSASLQISRYELRGLCTDSELQTWTPAQDLELTIGMNTRYLSCSIQAATPMSGMFMHCEGSAFGGCRTRCPDSKQRGGYCLQ